jgi:hypothetical protein
MLKNLSVAVKLAISFGVITLLLISVSVIGGFGLYGMTVIEKALVADSLEGNLRLASAEKSFIAYSRAVYEHVSTSDDTKATSLETEMAKHREKLETA